MRDSTSFKCKDLIRKNHNRHGNERTGETDSSNFIITYFMMN